MVESFSFEVKTKGDDDIIDITPLVEEKLTLSKIKNGLAIVFVSGSTCAITTMEYEPGLIEDLKVLLQRLAPKNETYKHNLRWNDDNGYAHLRASLIGPSLGIPLVDGKLKLGIWQQIVLIDFDNHPRQRYTTVQLVGE